MNNAEIETLKSKDYMILKLAGELRFNSALSLEKALKSIEPQQILYFDMDKATLLDSTIIGTMIKFLLEQNQVDPTFKERTFLLALNPDLSKTLNQIGFQQLLSTKHDKPTDKQEGTTQRYDSYSNDKQQLENAVLEAHQLLSKLDPSNKNYKNVIDMIKSHRAQ